MIDTEPVVRFEDPRGALIKVWPGPVQGEVYAVELRPGHPRGHHWHQHGGEWFVAVTGRAWLVAEDPTSGERSVVRLGAQRAYVPAGVAHALFCDAPALVVAIAEVAHPAEVTHRCAVAPPTATEREGCP